MGVLSCVSWIILGGIAGWLASIVTKRNDRMGCLANIVAGVVGAAVGGWVFSFFGGSGVTGLNLPSLFVAFVGAVIVLGILNFFTRKK
jgi:uncharacterized membrane protein YeaQ/YmgE (transglycosylase-associated protein family)